MDEYVANKKIEKEIAKKVRKKSRRWKVGRWITLALALWVIFSIVNTAINGKNAGPN